MAMDCCERESIVFGGSGMGLNERSWRESPERMLEASSASMYSYLNNGCLCLTTAIRLTCASVFCQSVPATSVGSHTIPVQKTPELSKYYGITFKFSSDKWKCFHQKVE